MKMVKTIVIVALLTGSHANLFNMQQNWAEMQAGVNDFDTTLFDDGNVASGFLFQAYQLTDFDVDNVDLEPVMLQEELQELWPTTTKIDSDLNRTLINHTKVATQSHLASL